jgi:hypothetical protein
MASVRMVHLRTVPNSFHARVLAARLGADGIVTQLRGSVDGPYPIGDVMIFVDEDDADTARQLLLADEVESELAMAGGEAAGRRGTGGHGHRASWTTWLTVAIVLTLWAAVSMRLV